MFLTSRFIFPLILIVFSLSRCSDPEEPLIIATGEITSITTNSAMSGGVIVYGEDNGKMERGLVWSTGHDPSINNYSGKSTIHKREKEYVLPLEGLETSTLYYVRAYVIHGSEVSYGDEKSFRTFYDKMNDSDGNIYYTIKAGNQEWISTNLKTSRYRNGDSIPWIIESFNWESMTKGGMTVYNNDMELQEEYGNLYNFYAVIDERGLCPAGWRVPGDGDWKDLEIFLGMEPETVHKTGLRGRYVGGMLKERGTKHWLAPNAIAMDLIDFSDLPGGYRHPRGQYYSLRRNSNSWTSTGYDKENAWYRNIYFNTAGVNRSIYYKSSGFSVRCMRDSE